MHLPITAIVRRVPIMARIFGVRGQATCDRGDKVVTLHSIYWRGTLYVTKEVVKEEIIHKAVLVEEDA